MRKQGISRIDFGAENIQNPRSLGTVSKALLLKKGLHVNTCNTEKRNWARLQHDADQIICNRSTEQDVGLVEAQ